MDVGHEQTTYNYVGLAQMYPPERDPPRLLSSRAVSEVSPSRVLRRALEEALEKHVASTVLFEALDAAGNQIPRTVEDVLHVVRGPLRDALSRRLDAEAAEGLLYRIEEQLSPYDPTTVELDLDELDADTISEKDTTIQMRTEDKAVPVVVLSGSGSFAERLQMTLGENRVATYPTHDKDSFDSAVDESDPAVVLIDGTDFPSIEARDVLKMFHVLPPTTARVLWGAELPYGRNLIELLEGDARGWVILELKEGISPLLDLVRSRRNARRSLL